MKKSERSLTAAKWDWFPLADAVAFNSREILPFNKGAPPVDIASSVEINEKNKNVFILINFDYAAFTFVLQKQS